MQRGVEVSSRLLALTRSSRLPDPPPCHHGILALASAAGALAAAVAFAAGPVLWTQAGTQLMAGRASGVSVASTGNLLLAPPTELLFDSATPHVWALEVAPDGTAYVALGEEGKVYRIGVDGSPEVFFEAAELGAEAMAWGPDNRLYVATGPRGSIYRLEASYDGSAVQPWFTPGSTYVWDLVFGRDGELYVATGGDGQIWRVDTNGVGQVLYDSGDTHVRALAIDRSGNIIAGTADNGHVYRVSPSGDVFVLYDSALPEITDIAVVGSSIWVGAFGGASGEGTGSAAPASAATVSPGAATHRTGKEPHGAIYRIHADGYTEQVWSSDTQQVHALAPLGTGVIAGTGPEGGLLRIAANGEVSRLARLDGEQVNLLRPAADNVILAATSNLGKLYRIRSGFRSHGEYVSEVKDTGATSQWGTIRWRADTPRATEVRIATRAGNTATPDDTWSEWADPYERSSGSEVTSPPARYIQWRAELVSQDTARTPTLYRVSLAYVPRNLPPIIDSFRVHPGGVVYRQSSTFEDGLPFAQIPPSVARELLEAQTSQGAGTSLQGRSFLGRPLFISGLRTFTWEASDPNGDELRYHLDFRGEQETVWKAMAPPMIETIYTFDTHRVPDGHYLARLTADDGAANAPEVTLAARRHSATFVIDNTPPLVGDLSTSIEGRSARIRATVRDETSLVRQIQYSVDGRAWRTVVAVDGVVDSDSERVDVLLRDMEPGEHTVVLRATDTALNAGAGQQVFVVQ